MTKTKYLFDNHPVANYKHEAGVVSFTANGHSYEVSGITWMNAIYTGLVKYADHA